MFQTCLFKQLLKIACSQLVDQITAAADVLAIDIDVRNRILFAYNFQIIMQCLSILNYVKIDVGIFDCTMCKNLLSLRTERTSHLRKHHHFVPIDHVLNSIRPVELICGRECGSR